MGKHKYRMEKNYYICQPFLTLSTRSMKKTYRILLAGFAALAVFSCNKDVKPAAPMSCEEVQKKLSDVAVATIKEVDPDNYKEWDRVPSSSTPTTRPSGHKVKNSILMK